MAQPVRILPNQPDISVSLVTLLVLPGQVRNLSAGEDEGDDEGTEANGVAKNIFWPKSRVKC